MHKTFIQALSLGLLLTITSLNASYSSFDEVGKKPSPMNSISTPLTLDNSSSTVSLSDSIFTVKSSIGSMSQKEKEDLVRRLNLKKIELDAIIPEEEIESKLQNDSNCFIFWQIFFKVSARTVGSLAIDIILDLSDGKINGMGVTGSVSYIPHLVDIINTTIEEVRAEADKQKKQPNKKP